MDENLSSLEKFKLSLEDGACDLNAFDGFGFNVILQVALGDVKNCMGKEPYLAVLDFLLERDDIPRVHKIDALELAGAILLSHDENHAKFALAFQYWRRALSLRLMDTEEGPIYKTLAQYKNGQLSEWCSLEDLQRIEKDPVEREMQSFLVRIRIFAGFGWRAACQYLFLPSVTSFRQFLMKGSHGQLPISKVLEVSRIVADAVIRSERPHEDDMREALLDFTQLVIHAVNYSHTVNPELSSDDLENLVDTILMIDPSYGSPSMSNNLDGPVSEDRHFLHLLDMFKILLKRRHLMTGTIIQSLRTLVQQCGRGPFGQTLMHYVCRNLRYDNLDIAPFLVCLGVNPYARDVRGDSIFHILALPEPRHHHYFEDIASSLLQSTHGHGLEIVNEAGLTAADLWFQKNTPGTKNVGNLPAWLQWKEPRPNALKCLAATAIRRHKVHYGEDDLPTELISFLSKHH